MVRLFSLSCSTPVFSAGYRIGIVKPVIWDWVFTGDKGKIPLYYKVNFKIQL